MDFKEKTLSTENIYNGKVVHLDKETVKLPNGKEAVREVIRHHGSRMCEF